MTDTKEKPTSEVATTAETAVKPHQDASPATTAILDMERVAEALANMQQLAVDDSEAVAARLAAKKLAARSIEELNAAGELRGVEDFLWRELTVVAVSWNESRIDGSKGVYVTFDVVDPNTGEVATIGSGHQDLMLKLYKLQEWKMIPAVVKLSQGANSNRFGKPVYLMEVIGPPAPPS